MFFKRKEPAERIEIVADLDRIMSRSVGFVLNGKTRVIRPIVESQFLLYANEMGKLYHMFNDRNIDKEKVKEQVWAVVSNICDNISREEVDNMGAIQLNSLFNVIVKAVNGENPNEKKN